MKKEKIKSLIDVHICNFARENGADCASKGAKDLTDNLKKWAKENTEGKIKVYRGGCQSNCEKGISIACYPEKNYLVEVKSTDADDIKKGLLEALNQIKE